MSVTMLKIFPGVLDDARKTVFPKLTAFRQFGYLAGGTALALQLNHRRSYDFDVFINREIDAGFRRKVREVFGKNNYWYVDNSDQISFNTAEKVGVTFYWYQFKTIFPLVETDAIFLADLRDVSADKAHTIGRRAMWRDYVDCYFFLKKGGNLEQIISFAKKKFSGEFNAALFLEQLVYFKDLEIVPIQYLEESPTEKIIKNFLEEKVREYLKKTS